MCAVAVVTHRAFFLFRLRLHCFRLRQRAMHFEKCCLLSFGHGLFPDFIREVLIFGELDAKAPGHATRSWPLR